ncbi:MAG: DNA topoisomerase I [Nitrososphaerales archaeon]|jgi:DNA topoisomerase-1
MTAYWKTLSHNGVNFPDVYSPRGLFVKVKGRSIALSPLAEEMAYHLAKKKDTPYIQDQTFTDNFMSDFARELPKWSRGAKFSDVDFSELFRVVDQEKAQRETMSKDEKRKLAASRKKRREALQDRYGRAWLDGKVVNFANWMVEPPGLFMGRGQHPRRGRWKPRVRPEDVTLNLGEEDQIPFGQWGAVVNDHDSMWMARWVDKLTRRNKYVWLHESSPLQQSRNKEKYDKANALDSKIEKIRNAIRKRMKSGSKPNRKVATVCYLIDHVGIRVGDEKGKDEADTVGASTLRVEHVTVKDNGVVDFDFLGKDSVRWQKSFKPPDSDSTLSENLREFMEGKSPSSRIFDKANSRKVNQFFGSIVKDLTAKAFRTYHATKVTEETLRSRNLKDADDLDKLYHAREANLKAAIFCNHQRTPPKTWEQSLEKKKQKLSDVMAVGSNDKKVRKLEMELDFFVRTKNYNLNTSLKNYIDPRVYKSWCDSVGLDWARIYSKSMQKKFSWVARVPYPSSREGGPVGATSSGALTKRMP